MKKKYLIIESYYLEAEDDKQAVKYAKKNAIIRQRQYDNRCHVNSIFEAPIGKIGPLREVPKE